MHNPPPPVTERSSSGSQPKELWVIGIVLGITLLTYLVTFTFDFVNDDLGQIVQNPFVKSWGNVPQYFTGHVWKYLYPTAPGNYYRPFFLLWCLLNYSLFGLNPAGWHVTTVLVHLTVTGLVYLLARKLTANRLIAAAAALLFGVHPIHLEAGAWVSGVTESLYTIPLLGAFAAYLQWRERQEAKWMALSWALYAASLLGKETAIVLPVLVFAHTWIYGARMDTAPETLRPSRLSQAFRVAMPYLPVAVAYLGVRLAVLKGLGHATVDLPFSTMVLTWPSLLLLYLRTLVFPVRLSAFYDVPYVNRFDVAHVLLPALVLLVTVAAVWYWQHRSGSREVRFATAWLVVPLLPVLNLSLLQSGDIAHDRYLYVPSFGFVLLVAVAIEKLAAGGAQLHGYASRAVLATLAICAVLCVGTAYQSTNWKDDFHLYSHALRIAPHHPVPANNLANLLIDRGQYQEATTLLKQALRERPNYWHAHYNFGYLAYKTGNLVEAENYFVRAIQLDPSDADQYVYLGLTRLKAGRLPEAAANLRQAIALQPRKEGYHFALGVILEQNGDCAKARAEFQSELTIHPGNGAARLELLKCDRITLAQ